MSGSGVGETPNAAFAGFGPSRIFVSPGPFFLKRAAEHSETRHFRHSGSRPGAHLSARGRHTASSQHTPKCSHAPAAVLCSALAEAPAAARSNPNRPGYPGRCGNPIYCSTHWGRCGWDQGGLIGKRSGRGLLRELWRVSLGLSQMRRFVVAVGVMGSREGRCARERCSGLISRTSPSARDLELEHGHFKHAFRRLALWLRFYQFSRP